MENRTMMQHNGNTYNSDNSRTQMRGSLECVSVYVSELRRMEARTKLSEGNGVWCRCGGMYGELERRSVSGMSRWTYSVGGIGERRCPLTASSFLQRSGRFSPNSHPFLMYVCFFHQQHVTLLNYTWQGLSFGNKESFKKQGASDPPCDPHFWCHHCSAWGPHWQQCTLPHSPCCLTRISDA